MNYDIILITGDADIDHPAFGVPLLARFLSDKGFKVGIIAQPQTEEDYKSLGRPNYFFGISSGNVDSMVNHYTAQRKIRSEDAFTPNREFGKRPDKAVLVYTQKVKQFFKNITVVIGGVEASMRRIPHYDFISDKVKNSIIIDSKADILVYGNGERQILELAEMFKMNSKVPKPAYKINGTCVYTKDKPDNGLELPIADFFTMTKFFIENYQTKILYYEYNNRYLVHYPPAKPLSQQEIDAIYNLPFTREPNKKYKGKFIKAFEQIKYSVLSHRGCYGGCSFCMIGMHQGKTIQSRSKESIKNEVEQISKKSYYKGTITDVAGATANMYGTYCKAKASITCPKRSCLYPDICENLVTNEKPYLSLLADISANDVFISSGVRFDLALVQPDLIRKLASNYTSGLLKLAPEHVSNNVLQKMYKPSIDKYLKFTQIYLDISKKLEKKQFIIPYLIVGFPGSTLQDALELALFLKNNNLRIDQVQEFTPTPMTIATMMYYTGKDYETGEKIFVPKGREIRLQKALAQWYIKSNSKLVAEALEKLGRRNDLYSYFLKKS